MVVRVTREGWQEERSRRRKSMGISSNWSRNIMWLLLYRSAAQVSGMQHHAVQGTSVYAGRREGGCETGKEGKVRKEIRRKGKVEGTYTILPFSNIPSICLMASSADCCVSKWTYPLEEPFLSILTYSRQEKTPVSSPPPPPPSLSPPHRAGLDIAKGTEAIIEGFVINTLVQVLDDDVSVSWATERWVFLDPHDTHRFSIQTVIIHCLQSMFSWWGRRREGGREKEGRVSMYSKEIGWEQGLHGQEDDMWGREM